MVINSADTISVVQDTTTNMLLEKDILDDESYIQEVPLDTIFETTSFSEYIEKGLLKFSTCKAIQPWLDSLYIQLGKPDSVIETHRKEYYWHNRNFHHYSNVTIFCNISEEKKPAYFDIDIALLDKDLQLIDDEIFLIIVKQQIQKLVFTQPIIKIYQPIQPHIATIGKSPYFSFWRDYFPQNYDSIMILLGQDKNIKLNWDEIEVKCLVDTTGKITKWKVDDAPNNEYEGLFQKQFAQYKDLFAYPILFSPNNNLLKLSYKTQFKLNNILEDSLNSQATLNIVLNDFRKGKYKQQSQRGKKVIDNKTQAGNTTFFNVERNGFEPVMANIPFDKKKYSFLFDALGAKLYTIEEIEQKWYVKQSINTNDFEGGTLDILDLNQDGYGDIILSSYPNMNGNSWSDIYIYHADKDSFLLGAENFCCISEAQLDDIYKSNKKYYLTSYGGSWYMPNTTSIYSWQDKKLQLEAIIGTELLRRDMGLFDYKIFFVMKNINGKMKVVTQINIDSDEEFAKKANNIAIKLFNEYFK